MSHAWTWTNSPPRILRALALIVLLPFLVVLLPFLIVASILFVALTWAIEPFLPKR